MTDNTVSRGSFSVISNLQSSNASDDVGSNPDTGIRQVGRPNLNLKSVVRNNVANVARAPEKALQTETNNAIRQRVIPLMDGKVMRGKDLARLSVLTRAGGQKGQLVSEANGQKMVQNLKRLSDSDKAGELTKALKMPKGSRHTNIRMGAIKGTGRMGWGDRKGRTAVASGVRQMVRLAVLQTAMKTGRISDVNRVRDALIGALNSGDLQKIYEGGNFANTTAQRIVRLIAEANPNDLSIDDVLRRASDGQGAYLPAAGSHAKPPVGNGPGSAVSKQEQIANDALVAREFDANQRDLDNLTKGNIPPRHFKTDGNLPPNDGKLIDPESREITQKNDALLAKQYQNNLDDLHDLTSGALRKNEFRTQGNDPDLDRKMSIVRMHEPVDPNAAADEDDKKAVANDAAIANAAQQNHFELGMLTSGRIKAKDFNTNDNFVEDQAGEVDLDMAGSDNSVSRYVPRNIPNSEANSIYKVEGNPDGLAVGKDVEIEPQRSKAPLQGANNLASGPEGGAETAELNSKVDNNDLIYGNPDDLMYGKPDDFGLAPNSHQKTPFDDHDDKLAEKLQKQIEGRIEDGSDETRLPPSPDKN